MNLSNVVTNDLFQPWRALLTIIHLYLMVKTSGFERPRAPVLQILWGIVRRTNIDYAERIWEEFTQSIHTCIEHKRNLSRHTSRKKRATRIVIPSIQFTKLIIHHLRRKHMFYPRPDSSLHLSNEEPVLGYLKFSAKGTKSEVTHHRKASLRRRVSEPTGSFEHDESPYALLGQSDNEEESEKAEEGVREYMNLDVADVSPQPSTEQLDEGFTATVYPNVQENLKLAVEEPVLLDEPASSSGTLSSLQHLSRDFSFGDQFFRDKHSDADKNAKTKVESMEHQQLKATTTDTTTTTTTTLPPPQAPQQSTTEAMMVKRIGELEHILADLIQVNKNMEERLDKHGARLYTLKQLL
nr:hypothetical protein [Tanacetum cinerariifolium]